ncbi:MAG TPA: VWA domain-containing protein [Thermoanaerobaculia bacterium]|jgi:VWFA-related protein|nr:VWA domain-containing protein [Thermoanaerobaculia bacterium]
MRVFSLLLVALPAFAQSPASSEPVLWPEAQRAFFQDGPGLLLTLDQQETFLSLDEAGRDAFIGEMLGRDPVPGTPANELVEGIARRRRLVASEPQTLLPLDARAELLFLRGRPAERLVLDCAAIFKPMEIWSYPGDDGTPRDLVLYRPSSGEPFILWLPIDSKRALYSNEAEYWLDQAEAEGHRVKRIDRFFCHDSDRVDKATGMDGIQRKQSGTMAVSRWDLRGRSEDTIQDFRWALPRERAAFLAAPADLATWAHAAVATPLPPAPVALKPGDVSLDFPYWQGQRLTARVLIPLPSTAGMATVQVDGKPRVRLALDGVLDSGGAVFETFRLRYQVPPPGEGSPALVFERALRPGQSFVLRLRLRDETSGAVATVARGFRVPAAIQTLLPAAATAGAVGGETVSAGIAGVVGSDTLLLLPAPAEVVLNTWEAQTVVTGSRIAKVVFLVDGQAQLSRTKPPYAADLRLATFPREQVVRAEGYDAGGALVAWDQVVLNQARGGFRVLITDPRRGTRSSGKVLAHAEVVVPEDHKVAEVEFRVNDRKVASLSQAPWQTEVQVPEEDLAWVSVVAVLDDGTRAEDVRFLRAPANLSEMEVDLVELYATVLDLGGHPIQGLPATDFEVREGGRPQKLTRFEQVGNLPLSLGIAIDTSFSMASSLSEAHRAAAGFVKHLVTPRDRCFTLSFSSRPVLLMPPVDDAEAVGLSLEGLKAYGRTALYDAVLASLYYFRAQHGQRALVILTDGADTFSHASWEDALGYARRSGVAIYTIGLGLKTFERSAKNKLIELADVTGGRAFFIDKADELTSAYSQIEAELRSRYYLAYQSDRPADKDGFREIDVHTRKGKARVSRGVYP